MDPYSALSPQGFEVWKAAENIALHFDTDAVMQAILGISFLEANSPYTKLFAKEGMLNLRQFHGDVPRELCLTFESYLSFLQQTCDKPGRKFIIMPWEIEDDPWIECALWWRQSERLRDTVEVQLRWLRQAIYHFNIVMACAWIGIGWCDAYLETCNISLGDKELLRECAEISERCLSTAVSIFDRTVNSLRESVTGYLDLPTEVMLRFCLPDKELIALTRKQGQLDRFVRQTRLTR